MTIMLQKLLALPSNIAAALTAGGMFLLSLLILNLSLPIALAISAAGYLVTGLLIFPGASAQESERKRLLNLALKEGQQHLEEMREMLKQIKQPAMRQKIKQLHTIGANILDALKKNPQHANAVRQFSTYYLDATLNVLHKYLKISEHQSYSPDVQMAMAKAERILSELQPAYEKQLASVLHDVVFDLDTEMSVLQETIDLEKIKM